MVPENNPVKQLEFGDRLIAEMLELADEPKDYTDELKELTLILYDVTH